MFGAILVASPLNLCSLSLSIRYNLPFVNCFNKSSPSRTPPSSFRPRGHWWGPCCYQYWALWSVEGTELSAMHYQLAVRTHIVCYVNQCVCACIINLLLLSV